MKILLFILYSLSLAQPARAQGECKVTDPDLSGTYQGECKNGLANGKGEAKGMHSYNGTFKAGLPDGKGTYYYSANVFYTGTFQDGIKEGNGELHYLRNGSDSTIKGYWSGGEFRGKDYTTWTASGEKRFDQFEVQASKESGNTITFEISSTTVYPNGTPITISEGVGYQLLLDELSSTNGVEITKLSEFNTTYKSTVKYEIQKFPVKLTLHLSKGEPVYLELYKAAKWTIRMYINR
jgi:hypothetical protein